MLEMANPSGKHRERSQHASAYSFPGTTPSNVNPLAERPGSVLMHNPGISMEWTTEEQMILEEGLAKYALESSVVRYAKIAVRLRSKTVRDVALRCRWMTKKESSKRRREGHTATKRSRDKKEGVADTSLKAASFMTQTNVPPYSPSSVPPEHDSGIYKAIGGITGELLERNAQIFSQISSNLSSLQVQENMGLFSQTRDNLLKILNNLNEMPETMKQMPPLPVMLNQELANAVLSHRNLHTQP